MTTCIRPRSALTIEQMESILQRLHTFDYHGHKIRVLDEDGQNWLVVTDVLKAWGYKMAPSRAIKNLKSGEFALKEIGAKSALANCINKNGLTALVLFSNCPEATAFRNWANENLFKKGGYTT